jgi:uncharacterized protein with LGFP repeats
VVLALLSLLTGTTPAVAADDAVPASGWTAATPSVFAVGDSLFMQCGPTLGMGTRSVGMIGWASASSTDLRLRLSSAPDAVWPYTTEASHAEELADFRDASTLVIGLGTNDVRGSISPAQFRDNVNWFLQQAAGRPVLWVNLYRPQFAENVATWNQILADAAGQHANLRIVDWNGYATANPSALKADRVHVASTEACRQGHHALIQAALPPVTGQSPSPDWVDPAPVAPPTPNPVTVEYDRTGGPAGPLGAANGTVTCYLRNSGCVQTFAHGAIAWSPGTGAHVMPTAVATIWLAYADTGRAGYPVGAATCGLRGGGCRQEFEAGSMYWSPVTRAVLVADPFLTKYLALGAQDGGLGYPTSDITCGGTTAYGCYQRFHGANLFWSVDGTYFSSGRVAPRWGRLFPAFGYPITDTVCGLRDGGCAQYFAAGAIYYSPATGAKAVNVSILARYRALRGEKSGLRYPVTETTCALRGRGCATHFQGGSLYATSRTAPAYIVAGPIRQKWLSLGAERSAYGYPVADPVTRNGITAQRFQGGTLTYRSGRFY